MTSTDDTSSITFTPIISISLEERPAFSRFSPSSGNLIVSTYEMAADSSTKRIGSVLIFPEVPSLSCPSLTVPHRHLQMGAGVFRFDFFLGEQDKIICAMSDGSLTLCQLDSGELTRMEVEEGGCEGRAMLLAVSVRGEKAATSDSRGRLHVIDLLRNNTISSWLAHKLPFAPPSQDQCEVWVCEWLTEKDDLLASGGEDNTLRICDQRQQQQTAKITDFDGGVTFLRSSDESRLITGSYDQHIRVYDLRQLKKPLSDVETRGGVWNIEECGEYWVCSCMYGGLAVFNKKWQLVAEDEEAGQQLLYAASLSSRTLAYSDISMDEELINGKASPGGRNDSSHYRFVKSASNGR